MFSHFKDTDYVRDLRAELLNLPPKRVLKNDAYPSCNLPCDRIVSNSSSDTVEDRKERLNKRDIRRRSMDTLNKLSPLKKNVDICVFTDEVVCYDSDKVALQNSVVALQKRISHLQNMCMKLRARSQLSSTKRRLHEKEKNKNALVSREIHRILAKIFSPNQIRSLLHGSKRVRWGKEDICKAITVHAVSQKGYNFLREKLGYPLPAVSTLRSWINRSFSCHPGILKDVVVMMEMQAATMTERERICVLSFDEMNIDSRICYDQQDDRILGPHSNVLVVMVRGLFASWKQPIYFHFDIQMTAALMNEIIDSLASIWYNVVAVVADMGPKNTSVWKELGVTHKNSCFLHPCDSMKCVWVFADVPHLLKLLRNHLLNQGITVENKAVRANNSL